MTFIQYSIRVTNHISVLLECDYGDASGIISANERTGNTLQSGYENGIPAINTAEAIIYQQTTPIL